MKKVLSEFSPMYKTILQTASDSVCAALSKDGQNFEKRLGEIFVGKTNEEKTWAFNTPSKGGTFPLFHAVEGYCKNNLDKSPIEKLLGMGADVHVKNAEGVTALDQIRALPNNARLQEMIELLAKEPAPSVENLSASTLVNTKGRGQVV